MLLSVSTWVGYDLDGRTDINWKTSFILRLKEKKLAIQYYLKKLSKLKLNQLRDIKSMLQKEINSVSLDIKSFEEINKNNNFFSKNINNFINNK